MVQLYGLYNTNPNSWRCVGASIIWLTEKKKDDAMVQLSVLGKQLFTLKSFRSFSVFVFDS